MMKLISWNVNGLRACVNKGFLDYFKSADADIFCIQESKLQAGPSILELRRAEGLFRHGCLCQAGTSERISGHTNGRTQ